jgi:uncharacterized protein
VVRSQWPGVQLVVRAAIRATLKALCIGACGLVIAQPAPAASRLVIQDEPLSESQSDATIEAGDKAFSGGDYRAARLDYEKAATLSSPSIRAGALNRLGILYERALGVRQDQRLAYVYFRRAADLSNSYAQSNVGDCFAYGVGVPQNLDEALKWYRSAALQNVPMAFNALGWAYLKGLGVTQSPSDALLWYERGADQGSPNAAYEIGWIYSNIEPVNNIDAMRWYKIAAAHQHREAQNNIGALYEGGLGVERDYALAAHWYRLASDAGLPRAQYQLAQLYLSGLGVDKDAARAADLLRAAAQSGDALAQAWLNGHP